MKEKFWVEYQAAQDGKRKMYMRRVFTKDAGKDYFYDVVLRDPKLLAWVVTPPLDELLLMKDSNRLIIEEQRELAKRSVFYKKKVHDKRTGKLLYEVDAIDYQLVAIKARLSHQWTDRIHGTVAQHHTIDQRTLQLTAKAADLQTLPSMAELERRDAELRRQLEASEVTPVLTARDDRDVVDVAVEEAKEREGEPL
jgi:predicted nucleic acid-binding protein